MITLPKAEELAKAIEAAKQPPSDEKTLIEIIEKLEECKKTLSRHIFWNGELSTKAREQLREAGYRVFHDTYSGRYGIWF